jgi:copper homeostasis protein
VAIGILTADRRVDVARTRALVELARPMGVTFHRAFDETADVRQALEDVIATGADSLLTSGGAADVLSGADAIGTLARQAGDRIRIIAGGGLRLGNLLEVVRRSGVCSLHGSLTREAYADYNGNSRALEMSVRKALRLLREAHREQAMAVPEP